MKKGTIFASKSLGASTGLQAGHGASLKKNVVHLSLKKKFISDFLFQLGRRKSKIKRDFFTDGKGFFKSPCKTQVKWGIQTTHRGFKAEYGGISSMPAPPKVTA